MRWEVTKRNDWLKSGRVHRWIVNRAGTLRGICECWEKCDAERIAAAINHMDTLRAKQPLKIVVSENPRPSLLRVIIGSLCCGMGPKPPIRIKRKKVQNEMEKMRCRAHRRRDESI